MAISGQVTKNRGEYACQCGDGLPKRSDIKVGSDLIGSLSAMSLIDAIGIFGVIVFALSGALAASRLHMDPIGFLLLGTVTAIGGGTMRDFLLDRPVFWLRDDQQLIIALVSSALVYLFVRRDFSSQRWMVWADALGLSAFTVQGAFIAIQSQVSSLVVIILAMMTAAGGGVIRDILAGQRPMIFEGQLYASAAMLGGLLIVILIHLNIATSLTAISGFITVLLIRGFAIIRDIRIIAPSDFVRIKKINNDSNENS